jgi:DNA-binding LacI/PurR family transcriptional regulator
MANFSEIAETIQARISHGDYRMQEFPSGKGLAVELGVDTRTVEKAMKHLARNGVLRRSETGRYEIDAVESAKELHLALLVPAFPSSYTLQLHQVLDRLASARGWKLRMVSYVHFRDPSVASSLRGFDGLFFMPGPDDAESNDVILPAHIVKQIKESARPIVIFNVDTSPMGIPCIDNASPFGVRNLLDTLLPGGHRNVACVNTQPTNPIVRERIDQWRLWKQLHGIEGPLFDDPVKPYANAMRKARESLSAIIERGELDATAIFCTTGEAGLGVIRALGEHGIEPGRDVAVCAADDHAGAAAMLRPSLTCLTDPDIAPYVEVCLDWMGRRGEWIGPLCIHPAEMPIFVGESTLLYRSK